MSAATLTEESDATSVPSVLDPVLDPFDDADALGELEHEIVTLAAHIAAATHRLLELIAEFDGRRGWELGGHRSCAHWLHAMTGIDLGAAREKVRTARALVGLPRTSDTMARGELSYSAVRALTRVATPECEEELLEVAKTSTTAELERFVRAWRTLSRADEAKLERERWRSRRLSVFPGDDGMYVVKGRLPAETGALVLRAIEAASDALFRDRARRQDGEEITPKQRRADAVGLLAERAMAAGFGGEGGDDEAEDVSAETSSASAPLSGTRAERYQVMLHVDASTLRDDVDDVGDDVEERDALAGGSGGSGGSGGARGSRCRAGRLALGRSHLEDGTRVSAETSRRLSCDAAVVEVVEEVEGAEGMDGVEGMEGMDGVEGRDGSGSGVAGIGYGEGGAGRVDGGTVLDVGRRTRTIPPALRRALELRDRGCRFPGCGLRFTDAHHIEHWADGGETKLDNLILLCRFHHRLVHEGGWEVESWGRGGERRPVFLDPRGRIRMEVEPESRRAIMVPEEPADALVRENRARGVEPDGWSLGPRLPSPKDLLPVVTGPWRSSDIRWRLEARALEALDEAHFGG